MNLIDWFLTGSVHNLATAQLLPGGLFQKVKSITRNEKPGQVMSLQCYVLQLWQQKKLSAVRSYVDCIDFRLTWVKMLFSRQGFRQIVS